MPVYEYKCSCGKTKEQWKPMSECALVETCTCGEPMRKFFSKPVNMIMDPRDNDARAMMRGDY